MQSFFMRTTKTDRCAATVACLSLRLAHMPDVTFSNFAANLFVMTSVQVSTTICNSSQSASNSNAAFCIHFNVCSH